MLCLKSRAFKQKINNKKKISDILFLTSGKLLKLPASVSSLENNKKQYPVRMANIVRLEQDGTCELLAHDRY